MREITLTDEMKEALEMFEQTYLSRLDEFDRYSAIVDLNDLFQMYFEQGLKAGGEQ